MYKTLRQRLKNLSKEEYETLRSMSRLSKNLYNKTLYEIRQHFFDDDTSGYLSYTKCYERLKSNENYEWLPSQAAQQTIKSVQSAFSSFFSLNQKAKNGEYDSDKVNMPGYLDKDGFYALRFPNQSFQVKDDHIRVGIPKSYRNEFDVEVKQIKIPFTYEEVQNRKIKELHILPRAGAKRFDYRIIYEQDAKESDVNPNNMLSIDLGVDNFATVVDESGRSFILDGRDIKSYNRFYNKRKSRLQSIKDKQDIEGQTKRLDRLAKCREDWMHDRLNKMVHSVIKYCLEQNIGTIVVGGAKGWKQNANLGSKTNQNFVSIPFDLFKTKLKHKCLEYGINYCVINEAYTSEASFFDNDKPKEGESFSGKRTHRGLYQTGNGNTINADLNAALNIGAKYLQNKSNPNGCGIFSQPDGLASDVNSPQRIRGPAYKLDSIFDVCR